MVLEFIHFLKSFSLSVLFEVLGTVWEIELGVSAFPEVMVRKHSLYR